MIGFSDTGRKVTLKGKLGLDGVKEIFYIITMIVVNGCIH